MSIELILIKHLHPPPPPQNYTNLVFYNVLPSRIPSCLIAVMQLH